MFLDNERFPFYRMLELRWRDFLFELGRLDIEQFIPYPADQDGAFTGSWTVFPLFSSLSDSPMQGMLDDMGDNINKCPRTRNLLGHIPGLTGACFSRLGPNTHIFAHSDDPRFTVTYRGHLGLRIPDGEGARIRSGKEVRSWHPGEAIFFDGVEEHEAANESGEDRIVLLVDVLRDTYPQSSPTAS